jgi:hypothetical protein
MKREWLRGGLMVLAVSALTVGLWALLVPRSFYDDFPLPGRDWVSTLGPYNEHLVRDVGALNLALGVLLVVAAVLLERRLVQTSLVAYLAYAVPHFIFHVSTGHAFPLGDNIANLITLGLAVVLPLVLLALVGRPGGRQTSPMERTMRTMQRR